MEHYLLVKLSRIKFNVWATHPRRCFEGLASCPQYQFQWDKANSLTTILVTSDIIAWRLTSCVKFVQRLINLYSRDECKMSWFFDALTAPYSINCIDEITAKSLVNMQCRTMLPNQQIKSESICFRISRPSCTSIYFHLRG